MGKHIITLFRSNTYFRIVSGNERIPNPARKNKTNIRTIFKRKGNRYDTGSELSHGPNSSSNEML